MLSILLPVYNCKVTKLVKELYLQCEKADIPFEILIFDDKSRPSIKRANEHLGFMMGINYVELSENLGRSRIRNWLASSARYENLLFLDCDSRIKSKRFIKKYLEAAEINNVIYGGTVYSSKPKNIKKILHWTFGSKREVKTIEKRNKSPYLSFTSNNFLIKKTIFENHSFDKEIKGYGYEDLVFANELKQKAQPIHHIDNPVFHLGLENTDIFLKKIQQSIKNLALLQKTGKIPDTRLIQFYQKLIRYKSLNLLLRFYVKRENKIIKNLYATSPKLFYLDLYKLKFYHEEVIAHQI